MKNQLILASLFGMSLTLAACGSEEAGCVDDPAVMGVENHEEAEDDGLCTADTWQNYGQQFIADNCVQCHKNFVNYEKVQARSQRMIDVVESDRMPKTGPLQPDEKARFLKFLRCGVPQEMTAAFRP